MSVLLIERDVLVALVDSESQAGGVGRNIEDENAVGARGVPAALVRVAGANPIVIRPLVRPLNEVLELVLLE